MILCTYVAWTSRTVFLLICFRRPSNLTSSVAYSYDRTCVVLHGLRLRISRQSALMSFVVTVAVVTIYYPQMKLQACTCFVRPANLTQQNWVASENLLLGLVSHFYCLQFVLYPRSIVCYVFPFLVFPLSAVFLQVSISVLQKKKSLVAWSF